MKHPVFMSAVATAASLMGGVLMGATTGILIERLRVHAPDQILIILAMVPIFGGGALWGSLLARIHGLSNRAGASLAGGLSFGFGVIGAATLLLTLERALIQQPHRHELPIHILFTSLFVPATFLVATVGASAILFVSGHRANWFRSALMTGLTACVAFLITDVILDTVGMRVGAPRAAEHFTMLTVAFLGLTAAAFSGGSVLGLVLSKGTSPIYSQAEQGDASQRLLERP